MRAQARAVAKPAGGLVLQSELSLNWTAMRISGLTLTTEADHWRYAAINNAAELTCAADKRPWEWRDNLDGRPQRWHDDGFQVEVHIGPPPASGHLSADQLVVELVRLATGLDTGRWYISTI